MRSRLTALLGSSALWKAVLECVESFAPTSLPVLLEGPTGCGKTALAQVIHERSQRQGQFVMCALPEIPEGLRHSYLAGHTRGAFTGASEDRIGRIEEAKDGTLFLDELSLATDEVQSLLLLILDRQWVTRVGEQRQRPVNVRFIFATNQGPMSLLASGKWRGDFYYRLGFNRIRIPGLAERREDIMPLAELFLHEFLDQQGRPWRGGFSGEVEGLFLSHPWPGNVRELKSVCERAGAMIREERLVELRDLDADFLGERDPAWGAAASESRIALVHDALRRHGGNKAAAARELGLHRQELYRLLERHQPRTPGGVTRTA